MARKQKTVAITAEGRDKGKMFQLTEMPVYKAEKWAARAILAIASVSSDSPDPTDGVGGLANINFNDLSKVNFDQAEPLLDDMMVCVKVHPNPNDLNVVRLLMPEADDIEELATMLTLRKEILALQFDFFGSAGA